MVDVLKCGCKTMTGSGKVSLWYDKWLDQDYLYNFVSEFNLSLKEIYSQDYLHFYHLTTQTPLDIQLQIHNIFIGKSSTCLVHPQVSILLKPDIDG
jgi:hypothetical protein